MQSVNDFNIQRVDISSFELHPGRRSPVGLEEFLVLWKQLTEKNKFENTEKYIDSYLSFAESQDAITLVDFHMKTYEGQYPYHEMMNIEYLKDFVLDRGNNLIALYFHTDSEEPVGCGMMVCNSLERTGYLRSLIVTPKYQGKIDLKKVVTEHVAIGFQYYWHKIDKWYTETRTAHSKAQFLVEYFSLRPCGILVNKDIFSSNGQRESDILEITYKSCTLFEKRNSNPQLLPIIRQLYEYIASQFSLPQPIYKKSTYNLMPVITHCIEFDLKDVWIKKSRDKFNTHKYRLEVNNSFIEFVVNDIIHSAEKTKLHIDNEQDLITLILRIFQLIRKENIQYLEIFLPATNVNYQKILLGLNFKVFGYVPAWKQNENGILDDCIIFGYSKEQIKPTKMKLSIASQKLWEVLKPYIL